MDLRAVRVIERDVGQSENVAIERNAIVEAAYRDADMGDLSPATGGFLHHVRAVERVLGCGHNLPSATTERSIHVQYHCGNRLQLRGRGREARWARHRG